MKAVTTLSGISELGEKILGVSILHALSEIFRCVATGDTLKFYLLISNFYLLDVAIRPHQKIPRRLTNP